LKRDLRPQSDRVRARAGCIVPVSALLVTWLLLLPTRAQEILVRDGHEEITGGTMTVPFAFYNETVGFSTGASIGNRGWIQPQAAFFLTAVGSFDGTVYGFLALRDIEVFFSDRLFIDSQFNIGSFKQIDLYSDGNPDFPDQRAGSHDSSEDNFIAGDGSDNAAWARLEYILPLGAGRDRPKSTLVLRDGIVVEGARETDPWNPVHSGFSILSAKPFYRSQEVDTKEAGERDTTTAGVEFSVRYENTDFRDNPSRGSVQQLRYSRDWGTMDSSAEWETVDLLCSKYFSLGEGITARQRVVALNAWIIDAPSWDDFDIEESGKVYHRPPLYSGATLGGLNRLRGYQESRFHDRSAVYYTAEYRHIPEWNPLRGMSWLHKLNVYVDWMQFVGGVELGRVAAEFDLGELHSDMKASLGLGLRAMVNHLIVRADVGISDEDVMVQMTIDQPF